MPPGDIFAGNTAYFQNLAINRANQRFNRFQTLQGLAKLQQDQAKQQQEQSNWRDNQARLQGYLDLQKQKTTETSQAALQKQQDVASQRQALTRLYGALHTANKPDDVSQFAAEAAAAGVPPAQIAAVVKMKFGAAATNPGDKFLDEPLVKPMTGGAIIVHPDGTPFPPTITKRQALDQGGVVISGTQERKVFYGGLQAKADLQDLVDAADKVLPDVPEVGIAEAYITGPATRAIRARQGI